MSRVTVNIPLNRVEGDLDIEVTFDHHRIVQARSIGTLYRGFENMLTGRAPMDALVITPRICGICSITHLTAAAKAIESAGFIIPPPQAVRMRNLSLLAETVQSDLRQVFLMYMGDFAQTAYQHKIFYNEALEYYEPFKGTGTIEALRASKEIVKVVSIIGGQWPHTSHMVPGGICTLPSIIDMTLAASHIDNVSGWYEQSILGCDLDWFSQHVMTADALFELTDQHPDTHLARFIRLSRACNQHQYGFSYDRFISFGLVDDPDNPRATQIQSGIFSDGQYQVLNMGDITEDLSHGWYRYKEVSQPPDQGTTLPDRSAENGYSWSKAPRYQNQPAQTGPLAQALVDRQPLMTSLYEEYGDCAFVRELARLLRPALLLQKLKQQVSEVLTHFDEPTYIDPGELNSGLGYGLTEAARGALGHWVEINDGEIAHYQIITPTAWNASPRDQNDMPGPWEKALLGLEVNDVDNPVEIGHVIRSFDPCLVCTVHALGKNGKKQRWQLGLG